MLLRLHYCYLDLVGLLANQHHLIAVCPDTAARLIYAARRCDQVIQPRTTSNCSLSWPTVFSMVLAGLLIHARVRPPPKTKAATYRQRLRSASMMAVVVRMTRLSTLATALSLLRLHRFGKIVELSSD